MSGGPFIRVTLPPMLQDLYGRNEPVEVEAGTVGQLVDALDVAIPGVGPRLRGEDGSLRPFLTLVADGRPLSRAPETSLPAGEDAAQDLWFLVAVAGG